MRRIYPVYVSKRKEHSFDRLAVRIHKDSCLSDDVEDYLAKHGGRVGDLADKLLSGDFTLSRYTDHSYPL